MTSLEAVHWNSPVMRSEEDMVPYQYHCDCDGLVDAVRMASRPGSDDFTPYIGSRTEYAVKFSRLVMRKARRLGLIMDERVFQRSTGRAA